MKLLSQLRTSSFQLALLYMVVFATSVFLLLAFIYWRTAGFMTAQTDETIEAEIAGLAEQYRGRGVNGLITIIRERVARDPNAKSIYLLTTDDFLKLAGTTAPIAAVAVATGASDAEAAEPDLSSDKMQDTAHTRAYFASAKF